MEADDRRSESHYQDIRRVTLVYECHTPSQPFQLRCCGTASARAAEQPATLM
eukprot:SAG25_NODE_7865_length_453_cov_0.813559_1_plen_51_part_01